MLGGSLAVAVCLAASGVGEQTIALKYEPLPLSRYQGGGQSLQPVQKLPKCPKGFIAKGQYVASFGDRACTFVLGTQSGKPAALVDTTGKGDFSKAKPLPEKRGEGELTYYGPFQLVGSLTGKRIERTCRISILSGPEGTVRSLSPCGRMAWSGKILGCDASVAYTDWGCDGKVDDADFLEVVWNGTLQGFMGRGGAILSYGKEFVSLHVSPDGASIELAPKKTEVSEIRMVADEVGGTALGPWALSGKGGVLYYPTEARIGLVEATRIRDGKKWKVRFSQDENTGRTQAEKKFPSHVEIDPLQGKLTHKEVGGEHSFTLILRTADGLLVNGFWLDGKEPPAPVLELLDAGGEVVDRPAFEFG